MSLKDTIMADVKTAMKSGDQKKLGCLRFLQAAMKNKEIDLRPNPISEDDVLTVIKKQVKQRQDSIDQFQKAGRQDLVDNEKFELSVLESYLPAQLSREKVEEIVVDVISNLGATSMKEMGQIMKEVVVKTQGAADNRVISELIRSKLQ